MGAGYCILTAYLLVHCMLHTGTDITMLTFQRRWIEVACMCCQSTTKRRFAAIMHHDKAGRAPPERQFPCVSVHNVAPTSPAPALAGCFAVHIVASGEWLAMIAERYGVSVAEIMAVNPELTDPSLLQIGQQLRIPPCTGKPGKQQRGCWLWHPNGLIACALHAPYRHITTLTIQRR